MCVCVFSNYRYLSIFVDTIISKYLNRTIMYFHNITIITQYQINILIIEDVIINSHIWVGNWRLFPLLLKFENFLKYYFIKC